jgi:hypothetical protein
MGPTFHTVFCVVCRFMFKQMKVPANFDEIARALERIISLWSPREVGYIKGRENYVKAIIGKIQPHFGDAAKASRFVMNFIDD